MKHVAAWTFTLSILLAIPVQAQILEVITSSPAHGDVGVPLEATIQFTFNQPVELPAADYLLIWEGAFADGGDPYSQEPELSADERTISYTVRHLPNSQYIWFVYGVYFSGFESDQTTISSAVPYVISYTTGDALSTGSVSGTVTFVDDDAGKQMTAIDPPALRVAGPGISRLLRAIRPPKSLPENDLKSGERKTSALRFIAGYNDLYTFLYLPVDTYTSSAPKVGHSSDGARLHKSNPPPYQKVTTHAGRADRHPERKLDPSIIPYSYLNTILNAGSNSSPNHALVVLVREDGSVGGGAVVDLSNGTYHVEYLDAGMYDPLVVQLFPESGRIIERFGYYDPEGDNRRNVVAVSGQEITGVDLILRDPSFYAVSARESDAEVRPFVEDQYPAPDYELISLESYGSLPDGRSVFWSHIYYSPSQTRMVYADRNLGFTSIWAYNEPLSSSVRPIPTAFIDSNEGVASLNADPRVHDFLNAYPDATVWVHLIGGDYWSDQGYYNSPDPARMLWRIEYEVNASTGRPSLTGFVDMNTGEVVDLEIFRPLPAASAKFFEATAMELAQEQVDDPESLRLLRIRSFYWGEDLTDGTSDAWIFEYLIGELGRLYVEITPFGYYMQVDESYVHPESATVVPSDYLDSDEAVAIAQSAGGEGFLEAHGGSVSVEGGYAEEALYNHPQYTTRAVWVIRYRGMEGGSTTVYLDMATGELLGSELYEPLLPATAKAHQERALALVSARADDPSSLDLLQIATTGFSDLNPVLEGVASSWTYMFYSSVDGLISVHLTAWTYDVYSDSLYTPPVGMPVIPEDYVDSSVAMKISEEAGGEAFRLRHGDDYYLNIEGGSPDVVRFDYPQYAGSPVWAIQYRSYDDASLIVFVDMMTGALLEAVSFEPRGFTTADAAEPTAITLARQHVSDTTALQLFRVSTMIWNTNDGTNTDWEFNYVHPDEGRVNVYLYEFDEHVETEPSYRHPDGAPLVPDVHLDSDAAMAIAEATNQVLSFRVQYDEVGILIEGGYAERLGGGPGAYSNRPIWFFQYQGHDIYPPASLNVVLDMATGEVIDILSIGTEEDVADVPSRVELHPNYPNPFNPSTTILFDLPQAMQVTLQVYDVLGREVALLVEAHYPAGRHTAVWNAESLGSGLYFARLTAGDNTRVHSLLLQK